MKNDVKAVLVAALFVMLAFGAVSFNASGNGPLVHVQGCDDPQAPGCWMNGPTGGDAIDGVAAFLFGPDALPFEVLSLVLLVALVGALAMARLERPGEEGGDIE